MLVVDDTGKPTDIRPGWGAFLPDGKSVVFQHQSIAGADGNGSALYTRKGELSQIGWTSTHRRHARHVARSAQRQEDYLPQAAHAHQPDVHRRRRSPSAASTPTTATTSTTTTSPR